jgi:branched-subunit amino acid transport protein
VNAWAVVFAAGLVSYLLRISMVGVADRIRLPARLEDSPALVAPSAFAALAVTGIAGSVLGTGLPQASAPLVATAAAVLVVVRTGKAYAAPLAGMPTLWILDLLL